MNIIDWLTEDHDRLRRDLLHVQKNLWEPHLRERIKSFVSDLELHESVEEEILMPQLDELLKDQRCYEAICGCEDSHDEIWDLVAKFMNNIGHSHFSELQHDFFFLDATIESHFRHEEKMLFPEIRARLTPEILETLGRKAELRTVRFSMAS